MQLFEYADNLRFGLYLYKLRVKVASDFFRATGTNEESTTLAVGLRVTLGEIIIFLRLSGGGETMKLKERIEPRCVIGSIGDTEADTLGKISVAVLFK